MPRVDYLHSAPQETARASHEYLTKAHDDVHFHSGGGLQARTNTHEELPTGSFLIL